MLNVIQDGKVSRRYVGNSSFTRNDAWNFGKFMCPDTVGTLILTIRVTGRGKAELIKMAQNRTQLRAFVKEKKTVKRFQPV
jgi:hypothetical protein